MGDELFWWLPGCAVGYVVGTLAHEAGHLLCAMIGSIPIDQLVIGSGLVSMRGRIGGLRLELRQLPVGGLALTAPFTKIRRFWLAIFFLGGVLGNIAVIGVVAWLDAAGAAPTVLQNIAGPLVFTQIFLIATNLIPYRTSVDGVPALSDGLQLLSLLFGWVAKPPVTSPAWFDRAERWTDDGIRRDRVVWHFD